MNEPISKQQLTAAVVGVGFIGPVHIEALQRAGIRVKGVLGSNAEKSAEAAKRMGLPLGYSTLDELLADPEVDVVHLTTPNHLHFPQATAALNAGKHVLCEKPLAMNSSESQQLVELARQRGRVAGVAFNIRYYPLCHEAADRVASPEFGETLHISGSYVQDWLLYANDFNWRVLGEEGGSLRAVADIGVHWLDLLQFITGKQVESVCADLQTVHAERQRIVGGAETFTGPASADAETESIQVDTEDAACMLLKVEGGVRGTMHVSQMTAGRKNCLRFDIAGGKQSLSWNSETPNSIWIGHRDRPNELLSRDPALLGGRASRHAEYPGGHNQGFPDTFKQLFRDFYEHIAVGDQAARRTFPTFEDGHQENQLCEAILKSHREQGWVEIEDSE